MNYKYKNPEGFPFRYLTLRVSVNLTEEQYQVFVRQAARNRLGKTGPTTPLDVIKDASVSGVFSDLMDMQETEENADDTGATECS